MMNPGTDQEVMGVQNKCLSEYENHLFKAKETLQETDIKGNNNLFNSLKTEANCNHAHNSCSLFQVKCKQKLEVDNSLFSYSSFKKAMDLRTHNRTLDGRKRTIFDDAEYFAENYCYKLLPITFEQVDETIIQTEHNYSLSSLNSESELEEDCSRTMDYSQIKEKNYKRRRTKFRAESNEEMVECGIVDGENQAKVYSCPALYHHNNVLSVEGEHQNTSCTLATENLLSVQPLDLSAAPLVQEEKTDAYLREHPDPTAEENARETDEIAQLDSDKENVNSDFGGIRVNITRPDEKENYQPCDLFLNDIARLVPWLIDKDCFEVDILDKTCDRKDEIQKHRLYYVISESTWLLFQKTNERVILTNDQSLGQPFRNSEKDARPSYLIFDQFSLAKCLAEYCQEIGGCFEYTCAEEQNDECLGGKTEEVQKTLEKVKDGEEFLERPEKRVEGVEEVKEVEIAEKIIKKTETVAVAEELNKKSVKASKTVKQEKKTIEIDSEIQEEMVHCQKKISGGRPSAYVLGTKKEKNELKFELTDQESDTKQKETTKVVTPVTPSTKKDSKGKRTRKAKGVKVKKNPPPTQCKPKNSQMTTRSKSTSESETSQKSDKPVIRGRKREATAVLPEKPPTKRSNKPANSESFYRKTRSGKVLAEVRTNEVSSKKQKSSDLTRTTKIEKFQREEKRKIADSGKRLRSQKRGTEKARGSERSSSKAKRRR